MSQILAARTRVTVLYAVPGYKDQPTQGSITEKSTEQYAHVELLGLARRVFIEVPWAEVKKNEYRAFTTHVEDGVMVITEIEPKNSHPMNWSGMGEYSREAAWARAGARGLQTVFVDREGNRRELGMVFDPRAFERAAYQGYVGYGCSMTDGYYAPEKFESWVKSFRQRPEEHMNRENDVADEVKAALPLYQAMLAAVGY